jgi:hypothetical protein
MRQHWITAVCVGLAACAPASRPITPLDHLPVLKGNYFAIDSRETGHRYHVYVNTPESYAASPVQRYPIVYLLDGDSLFPLLAPTQTFSEYDDGIGEAIVVGIAYGSFQPPQNRRRHDFTAGADAFGRFLRHELIPATERRVRSDPDRRILFGQSRGGGFVLHSAFTDPDLFWGRIASNPTLDLLPALLEPPRPAARRDLRLMVASGTRDEPSLLGPREKWFEQWSKRRGLPWALRAETIDGATHAADAGRIYRMAVNWLLPPAPRAP